MGRRTRATPARGRRGGPGRRHIVPPACGPVPAEELSMERLQKGKIYTGTVEGYSSDGCGIVRLDGAVVFVPGAVRGETIDLRITKVMKTAAAGEIVRIHSPPRTGRRRSAPITAGAAGATSST